MRKVLNSIDQVFHYWANKVQSEGKAASVFFKGDKVYSYGHHFCIARHLPSGPVAFTTRSYSPTTSHHISAARSAARHIKIVYCYDPDSTAADNMQQAVKEVEELLLASCKPRIRQTTKTSLQAQALQAAENANEYLAALPESEREHVHPIETSYFDSMLETLQRVAVAQAQKEKERKAARVLELAQRIIDWRQGAIIQSGSLRDLPPALRLNTEKQVIQTSHNAEIPVKDALKLWPMVLRVMRGEKDYTPGEPLGNYRLTRIKTDGSIIVGCHTIAFSELQLMADKLGLTEKEVA